MTAALLPSQAITADLRQTQRAEAALQEEKLAAQQDVAWWDAKTEECQRKALAALRRIDQIDAELQQIRQDTWDLKALSRIAKDA